MTAAEERSALAALGRDLLAAAGPPGVRRGAALVTPAPVPAAQFDELGAAPDWLRSSCTELTALAERTALVSMAGALAGCIDGRLLGQIADVCGEAALDAAIAGAEPGDDRDIAEAADLPARGCAILAAAVPAPLRAYLPPAEVADVTMARARGWIERARTLP